MKKIFYVINGDDRRFSSLAEARAELITRQPIQKITKPNGEVFDLLGEARYESPDELAGYVIRHCDSGCLFFEDARGVVKLLTKYGIVQPDVVFGDGATFNKGYRLENQKVNYLTIEQARRHGIEQLTKDWQAFYVYFEDKLIEEIIRFSKNKIVAWKGGSKAKIVREDGSFDGQCTMRNAVHFLSALPDGVSFYDEMEVVME